MYEVLCVIAFQLDTEEAADAGFNWQRWRITAEALTERVAEAAAPRSRYQLSLSCLFFISFHNLLVNLQLHSLLHFNLFVPDTRTFVGATPRTVLRAEHPRSLDARLRYSSHGIYVHRTIVLRGKQISNSPPKSRF